MIGSLRNPPCGFEDVVRLHFKHKQAYIERLITGWIAEIPDTKPAFAKKMSGAFQELKTLFDED